MDKDTPSIEQWPRLDMDSIAQIRELEAVRPGLLAKLAASFEESGPRLLEQMREAIDRGDPAATRAAAHTLKGTAASLGALRLSECARRLEQACLGANPSEGALAGARAVADEFAEALLILRAQAGSPGGSAAM